MVLMDDGTKKSFNVKSVKAIKSSINNQTNKFEIANILYDYMKNNPTYDFEFKTAVKKVIYELSSGRINVKNL